MDIKFGVYFTRNIGTLYKDNEIDAEGMECKVDLDLSEVNSLAVNFKVGEASITDTVTVKNIEEGLIQIPFKTDVIKQGLNSFEIEAIMKNGDAKTSQTYTYYIEKSLENINSVEAETNYPILIQLINDVQNALNAEIIRVENEEARQILKGQVELLKSNLESLQTDLNALKSNISTNEATRELNETTRVSNESTRQSNEVNREQLKTELVALKTDLEVDGRRLLANYTHSGNPEFHIQSIDWSTGVATLTQPHGLSAKTEIMIVPNYIGLDDPKKDVLSVPIEWIKATDTICLVPIDSTTIKITAKDGLTSIPVILTSLENNNNVNVAKFHFEKPIPWTIDNIPPSKRLTISSVGYIKSANQYRYTKFSYKSTNGSVYESPGFLNLLGIPSMTISKSTHCIFGQQEWTIDLSTQCMQFVYDSVFQGRRYGYNNLLMETIREMGKNLFHITNPIEGVTKLSTHSESYSYMANGTIINIYT